MTKQVCTFENLPNELLLTIMSYLPSCKGIYTFFGLNVRLDSICLEYAQQLTFTNDIMLNELIEHSLSIPNAARTIRMNIESVRHVLSLAHLFPNVRSVVLFHRHYFIVKLNTEETSIVNAINTCLDVFRFCNIDTNYRNRFHLYRSIDHTDQVNALANTTPCSAVVHLSINECLEKQLVYFCALAPNLVTLKVTKIRISYRIETYSNIIARFPSRTSLTKLHIGYRYFKTWLHDSIPQIIDWYRPFLVELTLNVQTNELMNMEEFTKLFQSCEQLRTFSFVIQCRNPDVDTREILQQLQSTWWLDINQPQVLILKNESNQTMICTMPCNYSTTFKFPTDLNAWQLNKGDLYSPSIRFNKIQSIYFANRRSQFIGLKFIHFINQVFCRTNQNLCFDIWKIDLPDINFEKLNNQNTIIPILLNVQSLDFVYHNQDTIQLYDFHATTLVTWLLLAPTVRILNLDQVDFQKKMILGDELNELLEANAFIKTIFDRVDTVNINIWAFQIFDYTQEDTKIMFDKFGKIFTKAAIVM